MADTTQTPAAKPGLRLGFPDTQSMLAIILVSAVIILMFVLAFTGKTETDTFKIMVGGLMTVGFASVIGFYFGSSSSSKTKDDTINTAVNNNATPKV
jgi:hypothetical protein